jgi:Ser/Thr protein kinase RdoA (MazF antagonist)
MRSEEVARAVAGATSIVAARGLTVDDAIVLQNSNRVVLRLVPCDVVVRVAPLALRASAEFEVALAQHLAKTGSPAAMLDPRVEPRVHERAGFVLNTWTYYEPVSEELSPADYADALLRLHAGMRQIDLPTPHFTDRVSHAQQLVASRDLTPALGVADRQFLSDTLHSRAQAIRDRDAAEQLLHAEPHPGNLLNTKKGPVFIDFETACRGPVEFDIAHAPEAVGDEYPNADQDLLRDCRVLALAMVAAWRWDTDDDFPNGRETGRELIRTLREQPA